MRRSLMRAIGMVSTLTVAFAQVGCGSLDFKKDVTEKAQAMRQGPEDRPQLSATTFTSGLRCMDTLLMNYGVRDLSMLIEDLSDQTGKVKAGTKDMFISAVSQMSRRSRAIRLVAWGGTTDTTLNALLTHSQTLKPFENLPEFSTRGSISQYDDSMVKKQADAGVSLGDAATASAAKQAGASILGLDLNVIRTDDLSLVPGVTAKNSVLIVRDGTGVDAQLKFGKFGANFSYTLARNEGQAQALRMLTELAAIELFGKLTKTPYWTCIGVTDQDPNVDAELHDWWDSFVADPQSLVMYFQNQMRARGLYRGDIDGRPNPAFIEAVRAYQQALGLEGTANVNFEFFRRYMAAEHATVQVKAKTFLKDVPIAESSPSSPANAGPAKVAIADPRGNGHVVLRGEPYSVEVQLSQDSYMYCYLIDEEGRVNQFFPNPAAPNPATKGGVRMRFPGNMPFRFVANGKSAAETVACYATPRDLGGKPQLQASVVSDVNQLTDGLRRLAGAEVGVGVFNVKPQ